MEGSEQSEKSYFDVINKDVLTVIISKLESRNDIVNMYHQIDSVADLLSDNKTLWITLLKSNFPKIYNIIKKDISEYNLNEVEFLYEYALIDTKLVPIYYSIKKINLNRSGYLYKIDTFIWWDDIYDFILDNKDAFPFEPGMLPGKSYVYGRVTNFVKIILYMIALYIEMTTVPDEIKRYAKIPLIWEILILSYIFNYGIYEESINRQGLNVNISKLQMGIRFPFKRLSTFIQNLKDFGISSDIESIFELVISDLKNRLSLLTNS